MSGAIQADFITPKHSPFVTIAPTVITPTMTTFSVAGTIGTVTGATTVTGSAYTMGNLTTVIINTVPSSVGTNAAASVTFSLAGLGLPAPVQTTYVPFMIFDGTNNAVLTTYATITTGLVVSLYKTIAGGAFTASTNYSTFPNTLHYSSI
jgi:hypothetical protein